MKRKGKRLLVAVTALSMVLAALSAGLAEETGTSRAAMAEKENTTYTLRSYGGEICIFQDENSNPQVFTGIYTQYLTNEDKKQLEEGISVGSYGEILRLLEDFGS